MICRENVMLMKLNKMFNKANIASILGTIIIIPCTVAFTILSLVALIVLIFATDVRPVVLTIWSLVVIVTYGFIVSYLLYHRND